MVANGVEQCAGRLSAGETPAADALPLAQWSNQASGKGQPPVARAHGVDIVASTIPR